MRFTQILKKLSSTYFLSGLLLTGCSKVATDSPKMIVDCSGIYCAAEGTHYKGTGLGVWTYKNEGTIAKSLKISLTGLQNNQVTLVFSNLSNQPQIMPKGLSGRGNVTPPPPNYSPNIIDPIPTDITETQVPDERKTWKVPQLGENNKIPDSTDFPSTLRGQTTIKGFTYKLWVADQEWTNHAQKTIPYFAAMLFGTSSYPGMMKQYIDNFPLDPWGNYPNTPNNASLISPHLRTINIIIAPNGAGALQFFDPKQMYKVPDSNQDLIVFAGSTPFSCKDIPEGLCIDPENRESAFAFTNNLLHELTHLIHYYHRTVTLGVKGQFEPWLKEAIASSHGYIIAMSRFPHTPIYSQEFVAWFDSHYACSLNSNQGMPGTEIHQRCSQNYYKSGQAFLVFLVQHYGISFYHELLKAKGVGIDALDAAIRASGGLGFEDAFRRWGSMLALPSTKELPPSYGYPGIKLGNYFVPALNGGDLAPFRKLVPTLPDKIEPYSHLPLVDNDQSGQYLREIDIPPGVALTVYIQ